MSTQSVDSYIPAAIGRIFLAIVATSLITLATARAATPQISASLEPQDITANQVAELTVTVQGDTGAVPLLPSIPGLQVTPTTQSSSFQDMNGTITGSVSRSYRVSASQEGTYVISPIKIPGASTSPLTLRVSGAARGNAGAGSMSGMTGGFAASAAPDPRVDFNHGKPPFLRVTVPKRRLYVGETLPVEIKAYFQQGVDAALEGPPTLSSDAFTVSKLDDKPKQTEQVVGGVPYTVLTWSSMLGAIKAGDYALDLELPVTVRVRVPSAHNPFEDQVKSLFGDSLPDSFFNDADLGAMFDNVVEKSVTLKSGPATLDVLPLPSAGRPADFSGAVGQFSVDSSLTPAAGAAGDPLSLRFIVSGEGNFSRVNSTGLGSSATWRAYRPGARFDTQDGLGLRGQKTFDQAVIPLQAGHIQLPPLEFSYFDPDAQRYVSRRTKPIDVDVSPSTAALSLPAAPTPFGAAGAAVRTLTGGLFPNAVQLGKSVHTLEPVIFRPWFLATSGAPALLLAAALWLLARREQRAKDPARLRESTHAAVVHSNLVLMDEALQRGDAAGFFASARRVLQEQLAFSWQMEPDAVTEKCIAAKLQGDGALIRALFLRADKAAYARETPEVSELESWREIVRNQLKLLEEA